MMYWNCQRSINTSEYMLLLYNTFHSTHRKRKPTSRITTSVRQWICNKCRETNARGGADDAGIGGTIYLGNQIAGGQ